jgi:thiamine-monophosphate kinase
MMTTSQLPGHPENNVLREDEVIERIRRRIPSSAHGALRLGVGDDAALLRLASGAECVLTCDQFLENVHFKPRAHPPRAVGYKALARATSDIAAMGARPRVFLLSLALPSERTGVWLDRMTAGMAQAARQFGLTLAGGDIARTTGANATTAFSITVVGEIEAGRAVRRDSARPGDPIFVSGVLGAAQLGLELLLHGSRGIGPARRRRLLLPQFYPEPCIELGRWLAGRRLASAMMDLSDGLSTDLSRLCRASGVGARIYEKEIPGVVVPQSLRQTSYGNGFDALSLALHGGEDYGLLFTVPARWASRIPGAFRGTRITRIGEIVRGRGITLVPERGHAVPLAPRGWDHFRARK